MHEPFDPSKITVDEIRAYLRRTEWKGAAVVVEALMPGLERPDRRRLASRISSLYHREFRTKGPKPQALPDEVQEQPRAEQAQVIRPVGFTREPEPTPPMEPPPVLPDTASMSRIEYLEWQVSTLTVSQAAARAGSVAAVQVARELSQRHAELAQLRVEERKRAGADLDDMTDGQWAVNLSEMAVGMANGDLERFVEEYTVRHKLRLVPEDEGAQ